MYVHVKNKRFFYPLIFFFMLFISTIAQNSYYQNLNLFQKDDVQLIKNLESPESSGYWNLTGSLILIDATATGVDAHNWSWAVSQPWCKGSGTWTDPYVIENVTIDLTPTGGTAITIQNSNNVYFIIKNCTIYGTSSFPESAIKLDHSSNGTIIKNNLTTNRWQVHLLNSYNITIKNNTMADGNMGIYLQTSDNNLIINNTIQRHTYGIYNLQSDNCEIKNNKIYDCFIYGLYIFNAINEKVFGNKFKSMGIYIDGTLPNLNTYEIPINNTLENKPIYFIKGKNYLNNNNFSNVGQIILLNCNHSKISGLKFSNIGISLAIYFSKNNSIFNNTFNNDSNNQGTIHLDNSIFNNIYNNTLDNCRISIYLVDNSKNNKIYNNSISNSPFAAIYLHNSISNQIFSNTIDNNQRGTYFTGDSLNNSIFYNKLINNYIGLECNSDNNTFEENIFNINDYGLYLYDCKENVIINNIISNHTNIAVRLENSNKTKVISNKVKDNKDIGIYVESNSNLLYKNEFINNKIHAIDNGTNNVWDNGQIGNYWDNYSGADANDDGIGDQPYKIPGSAGSIDNFPIWDDGPTAKEEISDEEEEKDKEKSDDFLIIVLILIIIAGLAIPIGIYIYKNQEKVKESLSNLMKKIRNKR